MTTGADSIKDFLVGLGFKVDQAGLKTFLGTLEGVTRAAMAVGVGVTAAATATVAAVAEISEKFEDMYYASQRIHSTVSNVQGYDFAIGQLGGSADESLSSLEALGSFLRSNPGGEKFIQSIGVATRDANGELRDNVKIQEDLARRYKTMPFYRAKVYAGLLGTDEKTLIAMMKDVDKFKDKYADMYKAAGVDPEKAAAGAVLFMNKLRELRAEGGVLAVMFGERLAPAALFFMNIVEKTIWLIEKLDQVTGGLSTAFISTAVGIGIASKATKILGLDLIGLMGKAIAPLLLRLAVLASSALPAVGDAILAVAAAIEAGGIIAFGWVALIIGAIAAIGYGAYQLFEHWGDVEKFFGNMWDGLKKTFKAGWDYIKPYVEAMAKLVKKDWAGALGAVAGGVIGFAVAGPVGAVAGAVAGGALGQQMGSPEGRKALADSLKGAGKDAMAFFQKAGWSAAQAAGIAANIHRESGFNAGAVGDGGRAIGLGQWHPDRQKAFAAWAGHDIRQSTFEEQLGFINFELTKGREKVAGNILRATKDAFSAGAVVSTHYERPGNVNGEANARGALAEGYFSGANLAPNGGKKVTIEQNNKTDIHVHGTTTPKETAKAVIDSQTRVHGDAVRNLKGAVV